MMNLFQPSVKLLRKVRVGSKLKRVYEPPQTPLDRLLASPQGDPVKIAELVELRNRLDPFVLPAASTGNSPASTVWPTTGKSPRLVSRGTRRCSAR